MPGTQIKVAQSVVDSLDELLGDLRDAIESIREVDLISEGSNSEITGHLNDLRSAWLHARNSLRDQGWNI